MTPNVSYSNSLNFFVLHKTLKQMPTITEQVSFIAGLCSSTFSLTSFTRQSVKKALLKINVLKWMLVVSHPAAVFGNNISLTQQSNMFLFCEFY